MNERAQAAALGDGPLAMFDDGLPLQFLRGPHCATGRAEVTAEVDTMGEISKQEDDWQAKATAAAIAGARKIALDSGPRMNTPVGRLTDHEWGMIVTAVIFGWIEVRVQQAIAKGLDQEQAVRMTALSPDPCDVAVARSILPTLADTAGIDWTQPLAAWSKDVMTDFLMLTWQLLRDAEHVRDHGPGKILRKSTKRLAIRSLSKCPIAVCAGAAAVAWSRCDQVVALGAERLAAATWHEMRCWRCGITDINTAH